MLSHIRMDDKFYIHYKTKERFPFSEYAFVPYRKNFKKDLPSDGFPYIVQEMGRHLLVDDIKICLDKIIAMEKRIGRMTRRVAEKSGLLNDYEKLKKQLEELL